MMVFFFGNFKPKSLMTKFEVVLESWWTPDGLLVGSWWIPDRVYQDLWLSVKSSDFFIHAHKFLSFAVQKLICFQNDTFMPFGNYAIIKVITAIISGKCLLKPKKKGCFIWKGLDLCVMLLVSFLVERHL